MGSLLCRDGYSFNKFHCDKKNPQFDTTSRVLYKDKDSLFDEIKTQDVCGDMFELKKTMNSNSHPTNQFLYDEMIRKVPLKLSDELNGCIIMEAVF